VKIVLLDGDIDLSPIVVTRFLFGFIRAADDARHDNGRDHAEDGDHGEKLHQRKRTLKSRMSFHGPGVCRRPAASLRLIAASLLNHLCLSKNTLRFAGSGRKVHKGGNEIHDCADCAVQSRGRVGPRRVFVAFVQDECFAAQGGQATYT
jgi:hypothetical protein